MGGWGGISEAAAVRGKELDDTDESSRGTGQVREILFLLFLLPLLFDMLIQYAFIHEYCMLLLTVGI